MSKCRFLIFTVAFLSFSFAFFIPLEDEAKQKGANNLSQEAPSPDIKAIDDISSTPTQPKLIHYTVKVGDTLSGIFEQFDIPYRTLQHVLSVDRNHLQLDTIQPGDEIEVVIDEKGKLSRLTYHISLVEKAVYTRENDKSFSYAFEEMEGEWRNILFSGEINGSFSISAHRIGLTSNQIANITRVLKDKIDFYRSLRVGDRFHILVSQQYLGDYLTGNSEIKGILFHLSDKEVAAFLAEDGRFYDRAGNSLERAFNRYPVSQQYRRITSAFNPKRKHPVTGKVTPHNGTDFATPVGAPVYAIGDGSVIAVHNHPYAGKYLVIEHNSVYKTRYLHLNKFLVKKGQFIKRGEKIALAGATGRLTGPHLHFEVLARNRAVNAMTADLPIAISLKEKAKRAFLARVSEIDSLIKGRWEK